MTLGPRLEFRQSQSLVMTPQLRQAIKLLQFNNLEAAAFVEEELERNPLLERDERVEGNPERPSAVQPETAPALGADSADMAGAGTLPDDGAGPLDLAGDADTGGYEAFGEADGVRLSTGAGSGPGGGGDEDWDFTERIRANTG
jgi:RNA polymerase sigma-54 factor